MRNTFSADVAVVGAGIVGLAHAYMALRKGLKVVLFDRDTMAVGASVRNFGLIWPVGQEAGQGLHYALKGREHWLELAKAAGFWISQNGSLHLAYHDDEWDVLQEFSEIYGSNNGYQCALLPPAVLKSRSAVIRPENLKGGMWSTTECTVNPREAVRRLPAWMVSQFGLITRFGQTVQSVSFPKLHTATEEWSVGKVFICSGPDFETLYPSLYDQRFTKCKLQMMKVITDPVVSIGPTLCAGLTLRHYAAFRKCRSLAALDARFDEENGDFRRHGIHVLLAQNAAGELILGDSHHYSRTPEPFDTEEINQLILRYLKTFTVLNDIAVTERWQGVYPKLEGAINFLAEPEKGVVVVNGLGGAGMTLSFGLAEEHIDRFL